MTKNTLDLWGDGDELDLIYEVERVFDIKVTNKEAEELFTVGDLYDLVLSKRKLIDPKSSACLSQAAFYRLRSASAGMGIKGPITPTTPLRQAMPEIGQSMSVRRIWNELGHRANLTLPWREVAWLPDLSPRAPWTPSGIAFMAVAAFATLALHRLVGLSVGWAAFSFCAAAGFVVVLGPPLIKLSFAAIPHRIETVGDLAREAAGYTFESLWQEKKGYGPSDLWFALTAILRQISEHKGPIDRETTFFARSARKT